jgi:hypothetical protein
MHRALAAFNRRAAALPTARPGRSQASAEYAQREGWGGDHRAGHRPCEAGRVERAWSQVARWLAPGRAAPHVAGYPTSPNRASSLHLRWELPAAAGPVVAAAVVLVVEAAPPVPDLYFWALQAAFVDGAGRHHGGGHSGLQWHRAHPDSRAVNWGGNGPDGRTLDGSASSLPSATGNANTRDLVAARPAFHAHHRTRRRGRLGRNRRRPAGPHAGGRWRQARHADGVVRGVRPLRRTRGGCALVGVPGHDHGGTDRHPGGRPRELPTPRPGGCDNTTALADGDAVRQITGTKRLVPQGARLPLGTSRP